MNFIMKFSTSSLGMFFHNYYKEIFSLYLILLFLSDYFFTSFSIILLTPFLSFSTVPSFIFQNSFSSNFLSPFFSFFTVSFIILLLTLLPLLLSHPPLFCLLLLYSLLFTHHFSPTTSHPPLLTHHFSPITFHPPLLIHHSSTTTSQPPLLNHPSSPLETPLMHHKRISESMKLFFIMHCIASSSLLHHFCHRHLRFKCSFYFNV